VSLTVDITDFTDVPMTSAGTFSERAEVMGFNGVGVRDNQATGRDAYIQLAFAAERTAKVTLFPAVGNPVTRHPAVIASLLNTLNEIAPGRIRLVLGGGDGSVGHIGQPAATIQQVSGAVTTIQRLLRGEGLGGEDNAHGRSYYTADPVPPVYLNASSPRMLELIGEKGDGGLLLIGAHPRMVEVARERIDVGAQQAGRSGKELDISFALPLYMDNDPDKALDMAKGALRFLLRRPHRLITKHWNELGLTETLPASLEDIPRELLATACDALGLVGTPERCAERLGRFVADTGAAHVHLIVYGMEATPDKAFDLLERVVLPAVR
jgi:5,10-methylenetetrahydromethanopterin reductase